MRTIARDEVKRSLHDFAGKIAADTQRLQGEMDAARRRSLTHIERPGDVPQDADVRIKRWKQKCTARAEEAARRLQEKKKHVDTARSRLQQHGQRMAQRIAAEIAAARTSQGKEGEKR